MATNNSYLGNVEPSIAAGIPLTSKKASKSAQEYQMAKESLLWRKENIRKQLRILDEQDAVNRYSWYNLSCDLSSQELERLIYYKGQLCFFYVPELDQFIFSPYALDGTIDYYGRYNTVHPVPVAEGMENEKKAPLSAYLANKKLDVCHGIPSDPEKLVDWQIKFAEGKACVILNDYTKQLSQNIIARQIVNDPLLDIMSDCIPFMRTNLLNATGITGMKVSNQSDYASVEEASRALDIAAVSGKKFVPMVGSVDFQELTGALLGKSEEFMLAMQSLDNYRLSLYGLDNGGLFQKKSHMLEAEQEMNAGAISIPLQDGLSNRQYFCDIVNALTQLGISCEVSETVIGADMNGDGLVLDEDDQTGTMSGEQDHKLMEQTMTEGE